MTLQERIDKYISRHRKESYTETDMRMFALYIGFNYDPRGEEKC